MVGGGGGGGGAGGGGGRAGRTRVFNEVPLPCTNKQTRALSVVSHTLGEMQDAQPVEI